MAKSGLSLMAFQALSLILGVAASYVPRQETSTDTHIFFFFTATEDAVTCQPLDLDWVYTGPRDATINLYVTNVGVSQGTPAPSSTGQLADPPFVTATTNVTITLGTNVDPSTLSFRWPAVNVLQGWYIFNASMPAHNMSASSARFHVQTDNDATCVYFPVATPSPVAASQSETTPIGAIIGGCFGLAIVLAALIGACIWFKRGCDRKRHGKGEYPNATHWKELGSADSRGALRDDQPKLYHHSSKNSVIHSAQSDEEFGADKSSIHSKLESTALSCEQEVVLAALPVLTHESSQSRTFAIDRSSLSSGPSTPGDSPTPERRLSVRDTTSNRQSLDSIAYPPTSPISPAANSSQPDHASTQIAHEDSRTPLRPGSQSTEEAMKQANRQSFGRKRKPVPVYDGQEPSSPSVPPPLPASSVSPSSSPLEASLSASPSSSSIGHYVTRNHSIQESGHPDLALKGSFGAGERPVHYLIPDMPMSQQ